MSLSICRRSYDQLVVPPVLPSRNIGSLVFVIFRIFVANIWPRLKLATDRSIDSYVVRFVRGNVDDAFLTFVVEYTDAVAYHEIIFEFLGHS